MRRRAGAIVALALSVSACGTLPQPPGPLPTPQITTEPGAVAPTYVSDNGFSRAERTALRVRVETCEGYGSGSAWALNETTAVTNMHVIEGAVAVEVTSYDGISYRVSDVEYSTIADLALLTIEGELPEAAVIADHKAKVGDPVSIAGFPEGVQLTVATGAVGTTVSDTLGLNEDRVFAVTAEAKEGSSGSAIVNAHQEVVGVLFSGDDLGFTYAVTLEALQVFLDDESTRTLASTTCSWM